jgi:glutamine amidotransferase
MGTTSISERGYFTLSGAIGVIDYGAGNLRSVCNALRYIGAEIIIVRTPDQLKGIAGVVLPGVGAFDDCINGLSKQRLLDPLRGMISDGVPFLGICIGYQILFERSEEFESTARGLGVFKGVVRRFPTLEGLKIPQIGWNSLKMVKPNCPLYRGIMDGSYVYFVHSYFPDPVDSSIVATETEYGVVFASSVWQGKVFGVQFHPEKSQEVGLRILRNFLEFATSGPQ